MASSDSLLTVPEAVPREVDVTLLFCDVVRSTELTRRLGDRGAYRVIRAFHDAVLEACGPRGGEELELRGDGVLLAFAKPRPALACAIDIQERLLEAPAGRRVNVRIGLHTGSALRVEGGYFGANVIFSARIAAAAAPGQVLASEAHLERLALAGPPALGARRISLKGIAGSHLVFAIPWRSRRCLRSEPRASMPAACSLRPSPGLGDAAEAGEDGTSCMLRHRGAACE